MGTIAFEAKRKLIAKSRELTEFSGLVADNAIWDSSYSNVNRPRQLLWFGEIVWEDETPAPGLGMGRREETFAIRFGIEINAGDVTQSDANAKAETLLVALETMLKDSRILEIPNIRSLGVVPIGIGEGPSITNSGGRAALVAAQVRIMARI